MDKLDVFPKQKCRTNGLERANTSIAILSLVQRSGELFKKRFQSSEKMDAMFMKDCWSNK